MTALRPSTTLVPLYRQVSDRLLATIMAGDMAPGAPLPTESALCAQFGVSRITVRRALDELSERRLIVRRRGVGTFVNGGDESPWSVTLTGFLEEVLSPNRLVVERETIANPPADVLAFAKLPAGPRLKLFEATNYLPEGAPLAHLHYYFPLPIGERLSARALAGSTHVIKLVERAVGRTVDHAEQVIEATIARGKIARSLRLRAGTSVLRIIRVYRDGAQQPIEVLDAVYHPKHYRYSATLYPRAGSLG